jgi:hypothetical protein
MIEVPAYLAEAELSAPVGEILATAWHASSGHCCLVRLEDGAYAWVNSVGESIEGPMFESVMSCIPNGPRQALRKVLDGE